jgi:hypothetical protein
MALDTIWHVPTDSQNGASALTEFAQQNYNPGINMESEPLPTRSESSKFVSSGEGVRAYPLSWCFWRYPVVISMSRRDS